MYGERSMQGTVRSSRFIVASIVGVVFSGALVQATAGEIMKPANYPTRPITVISCYGKGGGSDQSVVALQKPASEVLGMKLNKVNKPGGGGINCLPDFLQTPADGYTILQHIDTLPARYVEGRIDLNPLEDLIPLLTMNIAPNAIFIKADDERFLKDGKPNWDKFVAYAKANPGVSMANVNIPMELVNVALIEGSFGIKTKQVLFDKPAERYGSVIGGRLDSVWEQPGDVMQYVRAGKLAPILTVWPDRIAVFPNTPAIGKDYGLKWTPLVRWRGLFVRKGTPEPIVDYLEKVFKKAYESDSHQAFLKRKAMDIVPSYRSRKGTTELLQNDIKSYIQAFKDLGWNIREELR